MDFGFSPPALDLEGGSVVTFLITNDGAVEHEFILTSQDGIDAHVAAGHASHEATGTGPVHTVAYHPEVVAHEDHGELEPSPWATDEFPWRAVAQPGETVVLTIHLPDDEPSMPTRMVCLIPGHLDQGMIGDVG